MSHKISCHIVVACHGIALFELDENKTTGHIVGLNVVPMYSLNTPQGLELSPEGIKSLEAFACELALEEGLRQTKPKSGEDIGSDLIQAKPELPS